MEERLTIVRAEGVEVVVAKMRRNTRPFSDNARMASSALSTVITLATTWSPPTTMRLSRCRPFFVGDLLEGSPHHGA
jgi:hypothetical protein